MMTVIGQKRTLPITANLLIDAHSMTIEADFSVAEIPLLPGPIMCRNARVAA